MKKVIILILLISTLVLTIGLMACYEKPIVANAAEETSESPNYTNYILTFDKAPCHFYIPNYNGFAANYNALEFFKTTYLFSRLNSTEPYTTMVYQFIDNEGRLYYQGQVMVGLINNVYVNNNLPATNYNNIALTNTNLSAITGLSKVVTYSSNYGAIIKPNTITWATDNNYRFKIGVSIPIENNLDLTSFKIRACNLVDYNSYPNSDYIWYMYNIINTSSTVFNNLRLVDASASTSVDPVYPIVESYDSYFNAGYNAGYDTGFTQGTNSGYTDGFNAGKEEGIQTGTNVGYNQGFNDGIRDANDYSFLGLMTSVVDAPVQVFSDMFNFEILGFNMTTFFFSILTVCLVIALIKLFI